MIIKKVLSESTGGTIVYIDDDGVLKIYRFYSPTTEKEAIETLKNSKTSEKSVRKEHVDIIDDSDEIDDESEDTNDDIDVMTYRKKENKTSYIDENIDSTPKRRGRPRKDS